MKQPNRRRFLTVAGAGTAALIAGCTGGDEGDDGDGNGTGNGDDTGISNGDENGVGNGDENGMGNETGNGDENGMGNETGNGNGAGNGGSEEVPGEVDQYLSDANLYEGSVEDMTGEDSVTVVNGANAPDYAFDPPAIRVDQGTEVTWEWAEAVGHSVTHEDGEFGSGVQSEEDATFSHTFEESGNFLYYCQPHRSVGQKGAVIVE